ncbi:uncharacterized protein isoform X2 [Rhodnius prolixus]|uniref:uncharacterized protein isoform X2 n=1 Tax=Rhodnius prolixus TaxID=13249 RepID=UPI003D18C53C
MISTRTLLTSMVIVTAYVCSTEAKTEVKDGGADCECGKVKDVVCGSDNVTYMNECVLEDCEAKHKPGLLVQYRGACNLANTIQREKRALQLHRTLNPRKFLLHTRHQPVGTKLFSPRKPKKVVEYVKKPLGRQQITGHQKQLWYKASAK